MALPTGTISMSEVNVELGKNSTATISLNDSDVRSLAEKPSGAISMGDLQGKSALIPFGTPIEGGFFAGIIVQGGNEFAVIVASKASGESSTNLRYKNSNTSAPAATQTLNNGPAATAAMVADGNATVYPAAHFCNNLTINDYADWYLPARDELELFYRNLKPSNGSNDTRVRAWSPDGQPIVTYPEGNDDPADTMGVNRNSVPPGAAYIDHWLPSLANPSQTAATDFQSGGTEAFAGAFYWSSSEGTPCCAWSQFLYNWGGQFNSTKLNPHPVRAVRRVPLSTIL